MKALTKKEAAERTRCGHCDTPIVWARSEATNRVLRLVAGEQTRTDAADPEGMEPVEGADVAMTGDIRDTARGPVPVARYVARGTGTHVEHECV